MLYSKLWILIILLTMSALTQAQNISNKLGSSGDFLVKDNSSNDIIKVDENGGMLLSDKSHVDFSLSPGLEIFRTAANATLKLNTYSMTSTGVCSSVDMYTCGGNYYIPSSVGSYHDLGYVQVYGYHNSQYQLGAKIKFYSDDLTGNSDLHTNMSIYLLGNSGYISPLTLFYDNSVSVSSLSGGGNVPVYATNSGVLSLASSDKRLKKDIRDFSGGIEVIRKISPVEYRWKSESKFDTLCNNVGFIAQNIQEVIPDAVRQTPKGYLTLDTVPITAALVNTAKELIRKVELLEEENSLLKNQIAELLILKKEIMSMNKSLPDDEREITKK